MRNRAAVLAAARKVMSEKGLNAGVDEIARVAGVGVGTRLPALPDQGRPRGCPRQRLVRADRRYAREALAEDDPSAAFERNLYRGGELQASDRALSEVMSGYENVMPRAAERADLLELTRQVLTRAQEAGAIWSDLEAEDIPMLMCGLGATTAHPAKFIGSDSWRRFLALMLDGMRTRARELPPR